jgi:hypothetical protein
VVELKNQSLLKILISILALKQAKLMEMVGTVKQLFLVMLLLEVHKPMNGQFLKEDLELILISPLKTWLCYPNLISTKEKEM